MRDQPVYEAHGLIVVRLPRFVHCGTEKFRQGGQCNARVTSGRVGQ